MKHAIDIRNITALHQATPVLVDITAQIPAGSMVGVLGPNGAGKSTLLKILAGIMQPHKGSVSYFGSNRRKNMIAYVPQRLAVDWNFPITVKEVVLMGRYGHIGWLKRPQATDYELTMQALQAVDMMHYADRHIAELSGGQQQRVFLARAFVQQPAIYLLDEPLAGIDMPTEQIIVGLLSCERDAGKTVIMVHHDLHTASTYFDHIMLINKGLVSFGLATEIDIVSAVQRTFAQPKVSSCC